MRALLPGLLIGLLVLPGCADAVAAYQRATATSAGAAPLTKTDPAEAFAESMTNCEAYRRSVSVTRRQGGATLALASAGAGALGLAFVPAGAATVAGFTAAGTVLATGSAQFSSATYLDLSAVEISRRFNFHYNRPMEELAKTGNYTLAQVRALHSRCSLDYLVGASPAPEPKAAEVSAAP